jgi:hypothetical protein
VKTFAALLFFTMMVGTCADGIIEGDPSPGGFWLSRLQLQGDELVLTRSDEDLGFSFQIGAATPQPSGANSVWHLGLHHRGRFYGTESSLVFLPVSSKDRTLFLTEETNRRGDVEVGLLLRSPSPNSRVTIDGVTYIGLIPHAMETNAKTSLREIEAILTQ